METKVLELMCHPARPTAAVNSVAVQIHRMNAEFAMSFRIVGDLARLRIPAWSGVRVGPELWRHTCCEVFIAREGEAGYYEFNFAPSGRWMAYEFRGYRDGRMIASETPTPLIRARSTHDAFELDASIRLDHLAGAPLSIGLAVIVEADDGTSYWALHHPRYQPDFHDRGGFALRLDAPGAPSR